MDLKKIIASGTMSAVIGAILTEIKYGVMLGVVVAGTLLIVVYVTDSRGEAPRQLSKGPTEMVSMSDVTEDAIRGKLNHPDMQVKNVDTDHGGAWFANVLFTGNEENLRRVIGTEFDVQGRSMGSNEGTHARLVPNLERWWNEE